MEPADLERFVDAELKALPEPRAPRTLLPRVLAATVVRRRPGAAWWLLRAACIALPLVAAVVVWQPGGLVEVARATWSGLSTVVETGRDVSAAVRIASRLLLEPVARYLLLLSASFTLACAAFWTALNRIVPGGASR